MLFFFYVVLSYYRTETLGKDLFWLIVCEATVHDDSEGTVVGVALEGTVGTEGKWLVTCLLWSRGAES